MSPEVNVKVVLAQLKHLSPGELPDKHIEVFGEPAHTGNKDYLIKRIGWRIQSLAEGGLSERAKARRQSWRATPTSARRRRGPRP